MKRLFSILAAALILLSLAAGALAEESFTATAQGNNGDVVVEVTFSGDEIAAVTVVSHSETPGISDPAIEKMPQRIVESQSVEVDTVASATNTSNAILDAVKQCIEQAGKDPALYAAKPEQAQAEAGEQTVEQIEADVIVVGGGISGISAALGAADEGATVVLFEKAAYLGGSAAVAGGNFAVVGSPQEEAAGFDTSVDHAMERLQARAEADAKQSGFPDYDMLRHVVENSAANIAWLESQGMVFDDVMAPGTELARLPTRVPGGTNNGAQAVKTLSETMLSKGVTVYMETPVTGLIMEDGAVAGVIAEGEGKTYEARAKGGVVLASGGFGNNAELMEKLVPEYAGLKCTSAAANTGDGYALAETAGAAFWENPWVIAAAPSVSAGVENGSAIAYSKGMLVDAQGARLINESSQYSVVSNTLVWNPGALFVYDSSDEAAAAALAGAVEAGEAYVGDTVEELAAAAGFDEATFAASVEAYAAAYQAGEDAEFGKSAELLSAMEQGPFYAVRMYPSYMGTIGGVKTNLDAEVLDEAGEVIPGIYAVGEMANRPYYNYGYYSAASLQIYSQMGHVAGMNAAQAAAAAPAQAAFTAGEYTVETYGLNAPMTVVVTVSETGIDSIEVPEQGETIGIGDEAIRIVSDRIVKAQSLDVDTVSGATYTSGVLLRAVDEALAMAGGDASMLKSVEVPDDTPVYEDCEAEFVVIGGGAAGMSSAIHAAQLGVDVILLEKMDLLGGTSVMAGVGTQAGSSNLQLAKEDPYTADEFFEYLKGIGVGVEEQISTVAPMSEDYAHTFAYRSADMMNWLSEDLGLPMQATADHGNAHSLTSTEDGLFGEQLVRALKGRIAELDVDVRTGNRAVEIVMEDGAVAGVKVQTKNGEYTIKTGNVAICTGSYGGGEEALAKFAPSRLGYVSTASKAGTGDGLLLADAVGGKIVNAESITYRTIAYGTDNVGGAIGLHNATSAGAIIVNKDGERFVDEMGGDEALVLGIQAQEGGKAYVIMDQTAMDARYDVSSLYIPGTYENVFVKADTLDELAEKMGIDAENLKATVAAYTEAVESGTDEQFGRTKAMVSKLDTAPYYAASGKPSNHICAGGILTDGQARVLNADEEPIEGLYAAGETVNLGYHPIGSALTFGMVAAENVAASLAE